MADVAATAIGIASAVSVLQSLLQCYKDFHTAREYPDDFEFLQIEALLLHESTRRWAIAIGFINEDGSDLKQFKIAHPTQENIKLIELALKRIKKELDRANEDLNDTLDTPADAEDDAPAGDGKTGSNPKGKLSKKAKAKLIDLVHRPKDPQHPGLIKRVHWAAIGKEQLEKYLDRVTKLRDNLESTFPPDNVESLATSYTQDIKSLEMTEDDLKAIAQYATDSLSQQVLLLVENERQTGNLFKNVDVSEEGRLQFGDEFAKDWTGKDFVKPISSKSHVKGLTVKGKAGVLVGDTYGGKSFWGDRH
jgi:hypothetical protein